MNDEIWTLLELQGEIKIKLFLAAMSQETADEIAGEILHLVVTSPVAGQAYRDAYTAMGPS